MSFELSIEGFEDFALLVKRFDGKEGISKLFRFDVDAAVSVVPPTDPAEPAPPPVRSDFQNSDDLVGTRAVFRFAIDEDQLRWVHGVVARVTKLDQTSRAGDLYRFRIVPSLWKRKHHLTSRVFQGRTVPGIAAKLLGRQDPPITLPGMPAVAEAPWPGELALQHTYPVREYAVQYRESDYDYFKRILAEEGIYWYFKRTTDATLSGGEVDLLDNVVMADGTTYPSPSRDVPVLKEYRTGLQGHRYTRLETFEPAVRFKSNAALLRDYDFGRPQRPLEAEVVVGGFAKDVRPDLAIRSEDIRVYEHRGEYLIPDVTDERVGRQLEQQRRHVHLTRGKSDAAHLQPGYRFKVEHIVDGERDVSDDYVVTHLRHRGQIETDAAGDRPEYQNDFECVPASVPYRPKRPKPRVVQVTESALVVGKEEGSVYTDEHGRIRVQFHWDLEGNTDERSTTWLRVLQGWSGASYGLQFIPRVGMEVMVTFLGGDPDSPVVLGAVYNRTHPHPFHLPTAGDIEVTRNQALRSGLRTSSYPGGSGFNELSFDDAAGAEQVYIHAERDLDEVVKRNQSSLVGKSQTIEIGENQTNRVVENQAETVGGRAERKVGGDEAIDVKGNRSSAVGGTEALTIDKERRVRIGVNDSVEVGGRSTTRVMDDLAVRADGSLVTLVGQAAEPRGYALRVEGTTDISSADMLELVSEKGIRLRCGNSVVEIMPDSIDLLSPNVNIRSANAEIVTKEDKVGFFAKAEASFKVGSLFEVSCELGASLAIDTNLAGKGGQISWAKPKGDSGSQDKEEKKPTVIELADASGKPLAYRRFILVYDGGAERSFVLDKDGKCEVRGDVDPIGIRFPELVDPHSA